MDLAWVMWSSGAEPWGLLFGICGHGAWLTSGQWVRTQDHFLSFLSQPAYSSALVTSAHLSSAPIQHSSDGRQKRKASSWHPDMLEAWDSFMKMTSSRTEDLSWATQPFQSVQFSRSVMSDSLGPHESQHARLPCLSPTPGVYSTHVHWVGDAIQSSHPLSSPSPPAPNPSQHQGLFQWVSSSHQVAKVLAFQLQHQSF